MPAKRRETAFYPDEVLAVVTGPGPLTRTEVAERVWHHIASRSLQDSDEKRVIVADAALRPVFGGKSRATMFEMTKYVNQHLDSEPPARKSPRAVGPSARRGPSTTKAKRSQKPTSGADTAHGGGHGRLSAEENRAVELRAMAVAAAHWKKEGWLVEDVSDSCPYDLRCTKRGKEVHVEVKGTTGAGTCVAMTQGEVLHARKVGASCAALSIVSGIRLEPARATAVGGRLETWSPWNVDAGILRPTVYEYTAPAPATTR